MSYASVCSGIEAASVAWRPLGWRAAWFAEVDAFPSALLANHYPETQNRGDMTRFEEWQDAAFDVLVGGTPCQSFSVAGLRKGLADPRGNLMLTFGAIAGRYRPRWLVWENVPGVLSSNGGRDFGAFLGMLGELGYGFAYRVLDAQFFGIPQRRRRVFVVGCLGDWRRAAAVLFERHSLSGHPAPSRQAREVAPTIINRGASGGGMGTDCDGGRIIPRGFGGEVAPTLNAAFGSKLGLDNQHIDSGAGLFVAHTLRGEGFDASEDGTGRGTPLVPVAFGWQNVSRQGMGVSDACTPTLDRSKTPAIAFAQNQRDEVRLMNVAGALAAEPGAKQQTYMRQGMAVRRLTPRECERLQGFPDDYTLIPYRSKPACDGPRYKALGNSMAVPVMRWIGERISVVDEIEAS